MSELYPALKQAIQVYPPNDPKVQMAIDLLVSSAEHFGMPAWSDEHLGRVLAWVDSAQYPEHVVNNTALYTITRLAQYRFGLLSGVVPDLKALAEWYYPARQELRNSEAKPHWVHRLEVRYGKLE